MKKLLIITLLCFISTFVSAQTTNDSTKQDFKTIIYKDVKAAIESIASALKVGSEHVYTVLVKQQIVNSVVYLVVLILGTIALIISYYQFRKIKTNDFDDIVDGTGVHLAYGLIAGLPGLIMLVAGLHNLDTIITGFVNPEYGAIKTILEMLK